MLRSSTGSQLQRLNVWLEKAVLRRGPLPEPQILIQAPGLDIEFGDVSTPFHATGVGKLATATVIAGLVDEGRITFDTPVGTLLPATDLAGLPAAAGVDIAHDVTVDHLLTHTSGLPDYVEPPGKAHTDCSMTGIVFDPDRVWNPSDLLEEIRPLPAVGTPGKRFHYCDTGYILLGRIVEEALGQSFAACLQSRIFDPCGMANSGTPYDAALIPDELSALDVAPLWLGKHELSRTRCLSVGWAGGGIVASAGDLVQFQQALHAGDLIAAETLDRLTRIRHRFRRGIHYGAGCMALRFAEFFPPSRGLPQPTGHLGATATHLFYYPDQDAHVVLNFHSTAEMRRSLDAHIRIARLVAQLQKAA